MTLVGSHYATIDEIGDGSYGKVHRIKDHNSKNYALKQIPLSSNGIECLIEAIIMSTFDSPVINKAKNIFTTSTHLNIVQDLAISDLAKHDLKVTDDIKREWLWQIATSIKILHKFGIIHGDVKPSNILYFSDHDVKLADFTLSVKVWQRNDSYNHSIGTYAYCSPESLLNQEWSFPVDIWSLGATFYEIIYSKPLIQQQPKSSTTRELRTRYLNAILAWSNKPVKNKYEYIPIEASFDGDKLIDNLLFNMLKYNPSERFSIDQVMSHPYFEGCINIPVNVNIVEYKPLSGQNYNRVINIIKKIYEPLITFDRKDVNQLVYVASQIYQRLSTKKLDELYVVGCCWIASKLVLGTIANLNTLNYTKDDVLKAEKMICRYLSYCLIPVTRDFYY